MTPTFTDGVRAHQQLNETLNAIQAIQVAYPQIVIGSVVGKLKDGRLVDEAATSFLMDGPEGWCNWSTIGRHKSPLGGYAWCQEVPTP